jgi:hypothetical protein
MEYFPHPPNQKLLMVKSAMRWKRFLTANSLVEISNIAFDGRDTVKRMTHGNGLWILKLSDLLTSFTKIIQMLHASRWDIDAKEGVM